jgi:hypothetical protein
MPEESKFTGTLKRLRKAQEGSSASPPSQTPAAAPQASGRAAGKRSDPQWANITLLMRKSIKRDVRRRLEDEGEGRDLSTLIDTLLTDWLSQQR